MELDGFDEDEIAELTGMDIEDDIGDDSMSVSGVSGEKERADERDSGARAAISRLLEAQDNAHNTNSQSKVQSGSVSRNNDPGNNANNQDLRQTVCDLTKLVMHLVSKTSSTAKQKPNVNKARGSTFRVGGIISLNMNSGSSNMYNKFI